MKLKFTIELSALHFPFSTFHFPLAQLSTFNSLLSPLSQVLASMCRYFHHKTSFRGDLYEPDADKPGRRKQEKAHAAVHKSSRSTCRRRSHLGPDSSVVRIHDDVKKWPYSMTSCCTASFLGHIFRPNQLSSFSLRTARNALCGSSTFPAISIRFLPAFCFSSSFLFRVTSPP